MEERRDEGAGELADQLEQDAQRMKRDREELDSDIAGAKRDWESRQGDQSVPGAQGEENLPDEMTDRDSSELEALGTDDEQTDESEEDDDSADEDGGESEEAADDGGET